MTSTKILLAAAALVFSLGAYSQSEIIKKDSAQQKIDSTGKRLDLKDSSITSVQDHQSASSKDSFADSLSNTAKTKVASNSADTSASTAMSKDTFSTPKPNFGRYYIPALGSYNAVATTTDNKSIKITGDENNPGKIWVEGLTDTKFYALLKAVPGTYKVPAQKQDENAVAEGTLLYDDNSKQVSVCTGCGFDEKAPAVIDAAIVSTEPAMVHKDKKNRQHIEVVKKTPVISFTGTKAEQGTVSILR